jgi:plasmid stabilization system protein ParE
MPRGDKSAYTGKQKRKAEHIEEGYEKRGVKKKEAERRAWATVNKESGGGKKSGLGRGRKTTNVSSKRGGKRGGKASATRSAADRSRSAKKAAATRKRNATKRSPSKIKTLSGQESRRQAITAIAASPDRQPVVATGATTARGYD